MQPAQDDNRRQALEHLGQLAANLAHDWNNWITLLSAQLAELRDSSAGLPHLIPSLDAIDGTLAQATDASRRLLEMVRHTPGAHRSSCVGFPLTHWEPLLRLALGPSIRLSIDQEPDPPSILLDAPLFARTLFNLAANSRAAMPRGGSFTLRSCTKNGSAMLTVSDTGCGFDEITRARLLEPFFTTRAESGGTGLGMQTLHQFLASHNAALQIRSTPGQGAEFEISLPLSS